MAATPESKVKKKVVEILKAAGAWYCFPVASGYGRSGIPDILACWDGEFVAIECKANGGRTTALQARELERIKQANGRAWVIDENKIDELRAYFENLAN